MSRRKLFCCDASHDQYVDYYTRQQQPQTGGEIPAFIGASRQRGHGIGSVLSGLFRRVLPFLRANARNFATNAIKTGLHVADDVMRGQKIGESVKRRLPEGIKTAAQNISWQTGDGLRIVRRKRSRSVSAQRTTSKKKKTKKKKKNKKKKKKKRKRNTSYSDIFGY